MIDFKNKKILITGATGGIGYSLVDKFNILGGSILATGTNEDKLNDLKKKYSKIKTIKFDISKHNEIENLIDKVSVELDGLDILINNAGTSDPKRFKDLDEESWNYVLNTNLNGAYRVAKNFTDQLIKSKKSGSIVNIASILGLRVGFNLSSYATAKAGLIQLTKSMALELARSNIRVNAIAPGYILTEINDDFFATKEGQDYINNIPMRRLGLESDLDGILLLLASDASSFMTGSIIPVDGGHLNNPL